MSIPSDEKVLVALDDVVLGYCVNGLYYGNSGEREGYINGDRLELITDDPSRKPEKGYFIIDGSKLVRGDGVEFKLIFTRPEYHFEPLNVDD